MKTYRIHLIRHALTQDNLDGVYAGRTDSPLCTASPEGQLQPNLSLFMGQRWKEETSLDCASSTNQIFRIYHLKSSSQKTLGQRTTNIISI